MRHLELAEIAKMLSADSPSPEFCRHLAETCPDCRDRLYQVEALVKRFGHWSPEIAVQEGLEADELFAEILARGEDFPSWRTEVERKEEVHTWAVAWLSLERARERVAEKGFSDAKARDFALLAALIAENLGETYHPEWVSDLKAIAYSLVAATDPTDGADSAEERLNYISAAVVAVESGSGDASVTREVRSFLSRTLRE